MSQSRPDSAYDEFRVWPKDLAREWRNAMRRVMWWRAVLLGVAGGLIVAMWMLG